MPSKINLGLIDCLIKSERKRECFNWEGSREVVIEANIYNRTKIIIVCIYLVQVQEDGISFKSF